MIEKLGYIPRKTAIVHQLEGDISYAGSRIMIGDILLPEKFDRTLSKRTCKYDDLQEAVDNKELFLRGKIGYDSSVQWFGLVTDKFQELRISDLDSEIQSRVKVPSRTRLAKTKDRFIVTYPLESIDGETELHLSFDSGEFGLYGGNGQTAIRLGYSVTDGKNWLNFHNPNLFSHRVIHRWDEADIPSTLDAILEEKDALKLLIQRQKGASVNTKDFEAYFLNVKGLKAKTLFQEIAGSFDNASKYDLANRISEASSERAESTQLRLELAAANYLLGDKNGL